MKWREELPRQKALEEERLKDQVKLSEKEQRLRRHEALTMQELHELKAEEMK